jgi:hypothetical protein
MLADSTMRSLSFSVRRLSSEPARSMAEAVLVRVFSGVVTVIFTPRTAWERDEWAFNYEQNRQQLKPKAQMKSFD